jgi:alanine dehydrogenase
VRELEKIKVYSPNREHRERFAEQMTEDLGVEIVSVGDPREVVRGSDIVAACTNSNQAVVEPSWLEPGMHLIAVNTHEIHEDEAVLRQLDRYVIYRSAPAEQHFTTPEDWRPESLGGSSPEWAERERRLVGPEKIATLPEVILGKAPGRMSENEITGFNSEGTGVQFAALAFLVYQKAKERGLGNKLPLRWFVQDIRS